jgi:hypothetical protein
MNVGRAFRLMSGTCCDRRRPAAPIDAQLKAAVAGIGKPRVIEVAVPLDATRHAYVAGKAVVAAFARSLGSRPDFRAFHLYAARALGPDAVLAVHTDGEGAFAEIGKAYPDNFSPVEAGCWESKR